MGQPDPYTEIRVLLTRNKRLIERFVKDMPSHVKKRYLAKHDSALAALSRLEREAAERETALAEAYARGYDRASSLAMERVREVEAERDANLAEVVRLQELWTVQSKLIRDLQAERDRQTDVLREARQWVRDAWGAVPAAEILARIDACVARATLTPPRLTHHYCDGTTTCEANKHAPGCPAAK